MTTKDSEEYHAKCFKMVSTDNDGYLINVGGIKHMCVLDVGQPVKTADFAENIILWSGV